MTSGSLDDDRGSREAAPGTPQHQVTLPLEGYALYYFLAWWPVCGLGSKAFGIDINADAWSSLTFVVAYPVVFGGLFWARWRVRGGWIRIDLDSQTLTWLRPRAAPSSQTSWSLGEVREISATPVCQPEGLRLRVADRTFTVRTGREHLAWLAEHTSAGAAE